MGDSAGVEMVLTNDDIAQVAYGIFQAGEGG